MTEMYTRLQYVPPTSWTSQDKELKGSIRNLTTDFVNQSMREALDEIAERSTELESMVTDEHEQDHSCDLDGQEGGKKKSPLTRGIRKTT